LPIKSSKLSHLPVGLLNIREVLISRFFQTSLPSMFEKNQFPFTQKDGPLSITSEKEYLILHCNRDPVKA